MKQILFLIFALISIEVFSQFKEIESPIIKFPEFEIKFNNTIVLVEKDHETLIYKDTANIHLDLGETTQNLTIEISNTILKEIKIEQLYQTSVSVTNEGPHLDLLDWKHYTSDWKQLINIEKNKFISNTYSSEIQENFPSFTEEELIEYIKSIGYDGYAKLIKNPYDDGRKHWWIGLSKVSFKISGIDKNNNLICRIINFDIPMGC